jgi:long-chain acyl-CoA synthetase
VFKYIEERIKAANDNAISRAQRVQTFAILGEDFTVENGILTPTLKLKRKEALKRYKDIIESFYTEAKL